jgi:hypothetical protein
VTFLTLHVPGSNNGRGRAADGDAEWAERNQANSRGCARASRTRKRMAAERQTVAFGKPVVLVNGDSHYFRVDKPLSPRRVRGRPPVTALENFTRVETFETPYSHWVHVTVDASDPSVFTFRQRIVGANVRPRP